MAEKLTRHVEMVEEVSPQGERRMVPKPSVAPSQRARSFALQLWLECVSSSDPFNQQRAAELIDGLIGEVRQGR